MCRSCVDFRLRYYVSAALGPYYTTKQNFEVSKFRTFITYCLLGYECSKFVSLSTLIIQQMFRIKTLKFRSCKCWNPHVRAWFCVSSEQHNWWSSLCSWLSFRCPQLQWRIKAACRIPESAGRQRKNAALAGVPSHWGRIILIARPNQPILGLGGKLMK